MTNEGFSSWKLFLVDRFENMEDLIPDHRFDLVKIWNQKEDIAGAQLTAMVPKISARLWYGVSYVGGRNAAVTNDLRYNCESRAVPSGFSASEDDDSVVERQQT